MNGIQMKGKPQHCDKPVPGCLGRMVNLFDLTSLAGNRLLTDKPHNDGSSLSRSRSDVSRISSVARDDVQDKVIISESRRSSPSKKSSGTPVKMLIAQELSTNSPSMNNSSNVVAKLMGLDALPQQQHHRYSPSQNYWEEEYDFLKQIDCEFHLHKAKSEYNDVYEMRQQSQRTNSGRYNSPHKGRCGENVNEKTLALIRQKFMEAKRLSTDEKLRQTKEFQEALDVLSSNRNLFLKVLQEPNSLFSQHLYVNQSISPPRDTKRITVLRPSKMVVGEKISPPVRRNEKQTKKQVNLIENHDGFSPTMSTWKVNDIPSRPTRIVVLRPSSMKVNDAKAVNDGENLVDYQRDETLHSSVFSNGYTGDESSFEAGNLSDFEVTSPISRHSWDYVNKCGSPYSSSSLSRASCSPESLVCREAKKRLSERWAKIDQRHTRRSSGTLGEMLSLCKMKNNEICQEDNHIDKESEGDSIRNIQRSKSVAISKDDGSKQMVKTRDSKTSFTGKVTSLFFSRNKKSRKDKFSNEQLNVESQLANAETRGMSDDCSIMGNQGGFRVSEPNTPRNKGESPDQPSPISVLELPFEEDESATFGLSHISERNPSGKQMSFFSSKSNLIDKSPPIGSIARTLSWDESYAETVPNYHLSSPFVSPGVKNDKAEWLFLVQTLLSMADIDDEVKVVTNLSRWHSPISPLDPILKDKYLDLSAKETLHEAKRKQLRSNRKLVFDCVNAALVDITGMGTKKWVAPSIQTRFSNDGSTILAQKVWAWMEECCLSEVSLLAEDGEDDDNSLVERLVRKEVVGKGWVELSILEVGNLGKKIEEKLLEELVEESLIEWAFR